MEIVEQEYLVIASVDLEEAQNRAWETAGTPIDVVRLLDSEKVSDEVLSAWGFVPRPRWLNWCTPVAGSDADFLGALSGTERRNVRLGRRFVEEQKLGLRVAPGLTEEFMDEFLDVYDRQVADMPRGKNFARRWRDRLLSAADQHVSIALRDGNEMLAGSVWHVRPERSVLQMRFSAASQGARSGRALRVLYAEAVAYARESGLAYASLGNDPSLFGQLVQPGLFNFKSRMGFTPVPSGLFDASLDGEFADRILRLGALPDPSLLVTWGQHRGTLPPWPDAVSGGFLDLLVLSRDPHDELLSRFHGAGIRQSRLVTVAETAG
ncbi:hypothetical protein ABZV81_26440 [Streptomyces parvus]|uniref:hypothetical protein n=1 Tax=Streptomyces TaxID=1883 RepID=UPI00081BBB93|nr:MULTISPECIES: hypothetical protein [unclassified Streptomyces]PJN35133.1 hypothetical protein CG717_02525 [Streptomyces sp. CB02613]SCD97772.1 hypothetical protein GA0115253_1025515 [Streptomyces sp. Termitarium-T10T-6]